jgi:hypothetical protein
MSVQPEMLTDSYGEVINSLTTYVVVTETLKRDGSVLIGWTDGEYTHLDVLFVLRPHKFGNIQRGLQHTHRLLFVSVIGFGTFGFDVFDRNGDLFPSYVGEKLGLGENVTTEALTTLINEVIERLTAQ